MFPHTDRIVRYRKRMATHCIFQKSQRRLLNYQFALLWKPETPRLMDNYQQAVIRLSYLKRRMMKNKFLEKKYLSVMETYIEKGNDQLASSESNALTGWFLPHHDVLHQRKPEKLRVVFDCSACLGGAS